MCEQEEEVQELLVSKKVLVLGRPEVVLVLSVPGHLVLVLGVYGHLALLLGLPKPLILG